MVVVWVLGRDASHLPQQVQTVFLELHMEIRAMIVALVHAAEPIQIQLSLEAGELCLYNKNMGEGLSAESTE